MRIKELGNAGFRVNGTSIMIQVVGVGVKFNLHFCGLWVITGEHGPPT